MKKLFIIFSVFVFVNILSANSYSLKEAFIPVSDVAKSSSEIVVAKCTSSVAKFDEKTGFVYTYTTFKVSNSLKNSITSDEIQFRIIGGQDGDIRTDVQGLPKFDVNQEMVLFLDAKNRNGYYRLSSFANGIYKIKTDEKTGEKYVDNPPPEMLSSSSSNLKQEQNVSSMPLDDFISNIKEKI